MKLNNQVAIVTGSGKGIGVALAKGLAREGAALIINYPHTPEDANRVASEIISLGGKAIPVQADIQDTKQHDQLISAALEEFGRIDILVNNAGIEYRVSCLDTTEEQFDNTLGVNLRGVYFLTQKVAKEMIKVGNGGKIINISSCHDTAPLRMRSAYSVSKGGLKMLTKSFALELAEYNINVNAVAPGAILTEMNRKSLSNPEVRAKLLARIPLDRLGETEDCVGAVVYLASAESDYVTGATLYVDGGLLLRRL